MNKERSLSHKPVSIGAVSFPDAQPAAGQTHDPSQKIQVTWCGDMNPDHFRKLMGAIMSQGHNEPTAFRYAALIGNKPYCDDQGNVIVFEGGKEIARLKPLNCF